MHGNKFLRITVILAMATLLPAVALAEAHPRQQEQAAAVEARLYRIRHMNLESAYTLARSVCNEMPLEQQRRTVCDVNPMESEETLIVTSTPEIHARLAALLEDADRPPHTQSFHIVVLAANHEGSGASELPDGARRALEDIRAFLPYEGFRVLDTGWLRTARRGETSLTGPTGLNVELYFRGEPGSGEPLLIERFELSVMEPPLMIPAGVQGEPQSAHWRNVLSTSFSMSVGETVVVGTSKLDPEDEDAAALVILLTALEAGAQGPPRR